MQGFIIYDIPDFSGYCADRYGNIYSGINKGCRNRIEQSQITTEYRLLKNRSTKSGYHRVYMRRDSTNKREDVYVHRIIASLFIPNPNNLPEVNHKDNIPYHNEESNLEWVTHKQNIMYAYENGFLSRNELGQFCHK